MARDKKEHNYNQRAQKAAQKKTGYGAIHLNRSGNHVTVSVEIEGKWFVVIREAWDSNFSHIVEPVGILDATKNLR